ncbi:hypothetical protein V2O64_18215 [Verrucomicrobiaceae bacterium 227]
MPHLVEVEKKYRKKGLRVIAAEMQNSTKDKIGAIVKDHKMDFTVTKGARGPISVPGIPHAIVFGADGKIVFKGHPGSDDFEKAIKSAVKNVNIEPEEEKSSFFAKDLIPERTWTNSEGKPLVAAVTEIKGDQIVFKLKNGRKVPYAIEKLSEADQQLIKAKATE